MSMFVAAYMACMVITIHDKQHEHGVLNYQESKSLRRGVITNSLSDLGARVKLFRYSKIFLNFNASDIVSDIRRDSDLL